jgi:hypothetical protein
MQLPALSVGGLISEGIFALGVYWCCLGKSFSFTPSSRKDQAARIHKTFEVHSTSVIASRRDPYRKLW